MSAQISGRLRSAPCVAYENVGPSGAKPLYFGSSERPCAAWLHRAESPRSFGVVICSPFGYEEICAHRTLRRLADAFACASIPTLRFDYDGTGDSAGDDADPDRLAAWVASTREACATLRQMTGVERVYLVGLRLGALIAALASVGQRDVAGLVAIAPVVVGRTYLRELSVLQKTLELEGAPLGVPTEPSDSVETVGFVISPETRKAIAEVNLAKLTDKLGSPDAPFDVLALDRDDLPTSDAWMAHLGGQGTTASSKRMPGYLEMMVDPHKSVIPDAMLAAAVDWVSERPTSPEGGMPPPRPVDVRPEAELDGIVETPVFIDERKLLFGILTRPTTVKPSGRSIILLNAGSIHHVGPNRLHVRLARTWAAQGHEVLRLDITGIGESAVRKGQEENVVYSPHALEDVVAAVEYCRTRGASDVRPVGLCSGAYYAMKSASATEVSGFVAINPLTFDKPPPGPTDYPRVRTARETARYKKAVLDKDKWKKLLRGQVRLDAVAKTIGRHVAARVVKHSREIARRLSLPLKDDVSAELVRLADKKIEQRFVFASDDPGMDLLHDEAEATVRKLQADGTLKIDVLHGTDHTFTARWSHGPLIDVLTSAIRPER